MTELYINNQAAVLSDDFNIELIFENPYFTKSSNYSLDIELPMPANLAIFGTLSRQEVKKEFVTYPAILYNNGETLINGSVLVLNVEEKVIKVQLMSGNAEFNFFTSNDYADEIDLGIVEQYYVDGYFYTYPNVDKTKMFPSVDHADGLYLPVRVSDEEGGSRYNIYRWSLTHFSVRYGHPVIYNSVQPYLTAVLRRLIGAYGYEEGSNYLLSSWLRHIYIVNGNRENRKVAKALPHWTISELIDEVEKFFGIIFVVNQADKSVSFVDSNSYFDTELLELTHIMDGYTVDISDDKEEKDVTMGNLQYDLPSNSDGGYDRLALNILENATKREYSSYQLMESAWQSMSNEDKNATLFLCDGRYYMNYKRDNDTAQVLRNVNLYGDLIREPESDEYSSLKIVPAKINQEEFSIRSNTTNNSEEVGRVTLNVPYATDAMTYKDSDTKINIQSVIEGDENIYEKPVKSIMEVALYTGALKSVQLQGNDAKLEFPIPFADFSQKVEGQQSEHERYSLCLYDQVTECSIGKRLSDMTHINSNVEYTFYFKSHVIPRVNKVFLIKNQRYLAKMFKLTLTNKKVDRIIEGVFYRLD
ncbi:MAG: hypothetical protein ACRCY5_07015 [Phocaeicola sp.]